MKTLENSLEDEKNTYNRIHDNSIRTLEEIGVEIRSDKVIKLLESTGKASYSSNTGRLTIDGNYSEKCLMQSPRDWKGNPGRNALGIGGIPPFLKREKNEKLSLPATYMEFKEIMDVVNTYSDVIGYCSIAVKIQKENHFSRAMMMESFPGLKSTCTARMEDHEVKYFGGRDDWTDSICAVKSPLIVIDDMAESLIRAAKSGNNMVTTTMPLAGKTGPYTPEALITLSHAESLFMHVLAHTANEDTMIIPGCMPSYTYGGDIAYGHPSNNLLNIGINRYSEWKTGLPSVITGASTDEFEITERAYKDGSEGRDLLRKYGVNMVRHCFGVLNGLNWFSLEKFIEEAETERAEMKNFKFDPQKSSIPLHIPKETSMEGFTDVYADDMILYMGDVLLGESNGNFWDHWYTSQNIGCWIDYEKDMKDRGLI